MVTYNARGFAQYDDIETGYGDTVHIYESSSAEGDYVWLSIKGDAHLYGEPKEHVMIPYGVADGRISAHMNAEQARRVVAALNEWLGDKYGEQVSSPVRGGLWARAQAWARRRRNSV